MHLCNIWPRTKWFFLDGLDLFLINLHFITYNCPFLLYYITNQNLSRKVRLYFASFILTRLPLLTSATAGPTDEWESKTGQPHHQHRRRPRQQRLQHPLAGNPWGKCSESNPAVNFTNILWEAFAPISLRQKRTNLCQA